MCFEARTVFDRETIKNKKDYSCQYFMLHFSSSECFDNTFVDHNFVDHTIVLVAALINELDSPSRVVDCNGRETS